MEKRSRLFDVAERLYGSLLDKTGTDAACADILTSYAAVFEYADFLNVSHETASGFIVGVADCVADAGAFSTN